MAAYDSQFSCPLGMGAIQNEKYLRWHMLIRNGNNPNSHKEMYEKQCLVFSNVVI